MLCLEPFDNLPDVGVKNADKYVHFTFHFVLVGLWYLYFSLKDHKNSFKISVSIFFASILFGGLIELAQQALTTTRKGDFFDIFANTCGAFVSLFLILMYNFLLKKK